MTVSEPPIDHEMIRKYPPGFVYVPVVQPATTRRERICVFWASCLFAIFFHGIKENGKDLVSEKCNKIVKNAKCNGAEIIVTSCPLCMYNLKKYTNIKVVFLTEILAYALGIINEI